MKGLRDGKMILWLSAALAVFALALMIGENVSQSTASQEERRIAEVLSAMAGAGKVEVALFYAGEAERGYTGGPTGAVIVAEGAADMGVRLSMIRAARTLLGLPENAVDVFAMGAEQ